MPSAADFDRNYYLSLYPDVAASGMDPLQHFQQFGIAENRAPNQSIYNAATGQGAAAAGSDAYNLNMNNNFGGLLQDYGSSYLHANPDVFAAVQSGQFTSALDHYQKNGQAEGRNWFGGVTTALDPKTGAATFGGPNYGNILKTADAVSGYTGGAQNGRPAMGTATGGPLTMQPQKPASPFGDFDMNGFMSGIQKQMQDWQSSQTNSWTKQLQDLQAQQTSNWNTFKTDFDQKATYGGIFGNQPGQTTSPTYSPQSKNGFGQGWGGNNPFKIGSF